MTCPFLKEFHLAGTLRGSSCTAYESGRLRTPTLFEMSAYCHSDRHFECPTFRYRLSKESSGVTVETLRVKVGWEEPSHSSKFDDGET